ncbi:MAG TPA: hypothetical protein VF756_05140 [Thermoanaerobaculia bacterium]
MTDRSRLIVNLTALVGLVVLVAVVALTPEAKDIAEGVREQLRKPSHAEEAHDEDAPEAETEPVEKEQEETAEAGSPPPGPHLVVGGDGKYYPESGYAWANNDDPNDYTVVWVPGLKHQEHPHLIATEKEGGWRPSPGFDWTGDGVNDMRVEWKPGTRHPDHEHVIAAEEEERWLPAPGYTWVNSEALEDFRVIPAGSTTPP